MRNIIITGGELFNKGAQAMTFLAVSELRKRFPDHRILLLSEMDLARPEEEKEAYAFGFLGWYPVKFARCQKNPALRLLWRLRNGRELLEAEAVYRNCDAMVDVSGYALGSGWSARNNDRYLDHLEFAEAFGIPVYLMSQSFGPFDFGADHPGVEERCRRLLPKCRAILAREQEGYDALVNTYGLTNVRLAPDLVLNSRGIDPELVFARQPEGNLPEIAPNSMALVPNGRNVSVGGEGQTMDCYLWAIRQALSQGKRVYLLHHASSDAGLCTRLKESFREEDRVVLLEREFSCLEYNELVTKFDYLVASRFHSIVHAFRNGIPCVILGWAKKYEDLARQFGQLDYLFDIRRTPDESSLCAAMDRLNRRRKEESETIQARLASVTGSNVFDIITL